MTTGKPPADAAARTSEPARHAYAVLRHRDFRLLWQAEFASSFGTQMQRVAIAWLVYDLTGDALRLGVLGLLQFTAVAIVGLFGGVLADRRDRRKLLIGSQVSLAGTSGLLALLAATDRSSLAAIYAITLLASGLAAIGGPARQAFIPSLVPRSEIAGAMSLQILAMQVATVTGPVVSGWLISRFSVSPIFALDSLTFLGVASAAFAIRARPVAVRAEVSAWRAMVEGFSFLRTSRVLVGVMVADFAATFFGTANVLMPIFATEILDVGPRGLGFLYASTATGAVIGSLVMSVATPPRQPGRAVLMAIAAYGLSVMAFGLSETFWLSLLLLAMAGASDSVSMALRLTIRNLVTPDHLRGRVAATHSMLASGGPQLGEFEAGIAASLIGVGPSVAIGGLGTLLVALLVSVLMPEVRKYRPH
ncbi:MAG TPA: MFS transporter [Thermomicrobiales bacterium]